MHRINYFFIAIIFLFAGIYIGLFAATWHYLDHPVVKEVEKQPINVENNYYIKYYQHFDSTPKSSVLSKDFLYTK